MIHPRLIDFTNAEVANFTEHQQKLRALADFLWNDPRPAQEGKFEMRRITSGWNEWGDDPHEALARCGTAACACGWAVLALGDRDLFEVSKDMDGFRARKWMFGSAWADYDNSPWGASWRIDHWLKHCDPSLYAAQVYTLKARLYPRPTPWLASGWMEKAA